MANVKTPIAVVVTDLRTLSSERIVKRIKFMNHHVEIIKLTLSEATEIQKAARALDPKNDGEAFDILKLIIKMGVPAAADFEDVDFDNFPMDDLNKLSEEVLKYAGMDPNK